MVDSSRLEGEDDEAPHKQIVDCGRSRLVPIPPTYIYRAAVFWDNNPSYDIVLLYSGTIIHPIVVLCFTAAHIWKIRWKGQPWKPRQPREIEIIGSLFLGTVFISNSRSSVVL